MATKMSLTKEQKKDLQQLSHYFEKVEKLAAKNNIDLDVYISEYWDNGYAVYATEKVELKDETLKHDVERIDRLDRQDKGQTHSTSEQKRHHHLTERKSSTAEAQRITGGKCREHCATDRKSNV